MVVLLAYRPKYGMRPSYGARGGHGAIEASCRDRDGSALPLGAGGRTTTVYTLLAKLAGYALDVDRPLLHTVLRFTFYLALTLTRVFVRRAM